MARMLSLEHVSLEEARRGEGGGGSGGGRRAPGSCRRRRGRGRRSGPLSSRSSATGRVRSEQSWDSFGADSGHILAPVRVWLLRPVFRCPGAGAALVLLWDCWSLWEGRLLRPRDYLSPLLETRGTGTGTMSQGSRPDRAVRSPSVRWQEKPGLRWEWFEARARVSACVLSQDCVGTATGLRRDCE